MFFFPNDEFKTIQAKKMSEVIVEKEGLEFLGWREVLQSLISFLKKPETVCHASCSAL